MVDQGGNLVMFYAPDVWEFKTLVRPDWDSEQRTEEVD
jgi:hypothetical protein